MEFMYNTTDLRAIMEGYDPEEVSVFGGDSFLDEGAIIQAHKVMHSELIKSAKQHMKEGKTAAKKDDKKRAISEYQEAINDLKKLRKEADNIDDDHIVVAMIETMIRTAIPFIVPFGMIALHMNPIASDIASIGAAILGYINGTKKTFNWSAAYNAGDVKYNKAGVNGKEDLHQSTKMSLSRGDAIARLERLISICEKAIDEMKNSK